MKGIVWKMLVIEKLETAIEEKKKELYDLRKKKPRFSVD